HRAVHETVADVDIFIGTAAISDYRPVATSAHKMKKTGESLTLKLEQTTDVLASVAALKPAPFTVGFAAETRDIERYASEKLERKKLDMIAANKVGEDSGGTIGFGTDENQLTVIWAGGKHELPTASKVSLARDLVALIAERMAATENQRNNRSA
ncbi:MAG: bifunctional 4'-phosphopantothenoylcysteine decarboxylase/phosphopantothenoylcysteine synthetase, partial [Gammaproteobacteria bacterium]|nr:bifunctional 4'-phosphopantothenoylcysteine decarboxylase/phosphopantothenoylcysteine synthetase [Gammaproteobacteria bacterium]